MITVALLAVFAAAGVGLWYTLAVARIAPTRRLAIAAAALAPVWLLSSSETGFTIAVAVTCLLALAVVMDAVALPAMRHLHVERILPDSVGIGDTAAGEYRIRSAWPRTLDFSLHDRMTRGIERASEESGTLSLPPGSEITQPLTVRGRERGSFPLGPVVVLAYGPLGLVRRSVHYRLDDRITVAPSIAGIRQLRLLSLHHRLRDAGVRAIRRRGEGTSVANLREYVVGDDPRHIDWKASARRQRFVTREYSVEQGQTVMIAIDAGRLMTQLAGSLPRFEHALSAALMLTDIAVNSGDQVGLIVFDDEVRAFVPPARGHGAVRAVRQALVPAVATMVEPDYALAFRTLAARHRRRSLIVLFTDVIDARASQALIAHTARSAARHLPLVIALKNDDLVAAALPGERTSSSGLFESAAAEELLLAREEALQRMRQAGVSVVDVSPLRMAAAVINRYLEIKARASL